ncbi:MAG: hypothetical protein GY778_01700 [bacterium]|nr:hypothetical protein [bacterium]
MKKKSKKILLGAAGVVFVLILTVFLWIDYAAKAAVELGATFALGVDTSLNSMDVGVFGGSVEMAELEVANPEGFEADHFMKLDEGRVAVSLCTLMEEKVVVPDLTLAGTSMHLERRGGKANYQVILDNLKKFESKDEAAQEDGGGGKKFVFEKIAIRDVRVQVDLLPVGGKLTSVPVIIPGLELRNVGGDSENGVAMAELTNIILKAILTAVVDKGGKLIPGDVAGELSKGLDGLKGLGEGTMQVLGDVTAEAGEKVGEAIKEGGKGLEDAGKKLGEGLGGLLGGDKKDDKE